MESVSFERPYGHNVTTIDVCRQCPGIWFDNQELLELSPAATLELVAEVAGDRPAARQPWTAAARCPRCPRRLVETHDLQRATRFSYYRCPAGHGRYLTFYQFLRAKNFVRPLGEAELQELRARIRQINCANCGAPVNVERDAVCGFCRSPLALIDPDQIRKTLEQLKTAAEGKKGVDPALPVSLALERLRAERAFADETDAGRRPMALDLLFGDLSDPLAGFFRLLSRLRRS